MERLNRVMTGWANYFSLGQVSPAYSAVDWHAVRRLRRWLCLKHKVKTGKYVRFPDTRLRDEYGQQQLSLFNAHGAGDAIVVQASCRTNDPRVIALWQDDGSPMRFRALDELLDDVHGRLPFAPALTIAAKDGDAIRADAQNPSWGGPYPHEGGADDAERVFDPTRLQDLHEGFFKRHSHGDTSLSVSFARRGDTSRRMPSPHRPAVGSTMVSVSGRAASPLAVLIRYIPLMYSLKKPLGGRESEPPSPAL